LSWQPEPLEANEMDGAPAEPLTLTFARG